MDYRLAKSVGDVAAYLHEFPNLEKKFGLDTEASSRNSATAKLAGISVSVHSGTGIYAPIGHTSGNNLPVTPILKIIEDYEAVGNEPQLYNMKYDGNIFWTNCGWKPKAPVDVLNIVYLENPDRMPKDLKTVALQDLGIKMVRFEDLFTDVEVATKNMVINTKAPSRIVDYACADADVTRQLRILKQPVVEKFAFAMRVDMRVIEEVRKLELLGGLELNEAYVDEMLELLTKREKVLQEQIYRMSGVIFDIDSPKQLGDVLFDRMGIKSPGRTKSNQHKTDADTLENLAAVNPIVELAVSYRKVKKAKGTYFTKLKKLAVLKIPVRFQFNTFAAPTFRFAAPGGDPLVDGTTGINIQAVSNGEARELFGVDLEKTLVNDEYLVGLSEDDRLIAVFADSPKEIEIPRKVPVGDGNWPAYVLPKFEADGKACFREICKGCPMECEEHGIDVTRRIVKVNMVPSVRQAFKAPAGFVMLSGDYDGQEMRVGANMSGEPSWIEELSKPDGDLHRLTGCLAYKLAREQWDRLRPAELKEKRDLAKVINFSIFYGATDYTLARKARLPQQMATVVFNNIKDGTPVLQSWITKVQQFARREGYTTTYFGRVRWLKHLYQTGDYKMMAFADRSAVNTAIQGTSAEITRIAMAKVGVMLERENLGPDQVRLVMQVHDELSWIVREELLETVAPKIKAAMEFKIKGWKLPMTVSLKVGKVWGTQEKLKLAV